MFAFFGNTQIGRAMGVGGKFQFAGGSKDYFLRRNFHIGESLDKLV